MFTSTDCVTSICSLNKRNRLEQALENYTPARGLNVAQRDLDIFRDKTDFTGIVCGFSPHGLYIQEGVQKVCKTKEP